MMCVIIDANVAHQFRTPTAEATLVRNWIEAQPARLATGGKNTIELSRHDWMRRWLVALSRAGRLMRISDVQVNAEEQRLVALGVCRSDDPHVIALARKSGARILFSGDVALHQDFSTKGLVDNPRGCVFQSVDHDHLLDDSNCCGARC